MEGLETGSKEDTEEKWTERNPRSQESIGGSESGRVRYGETSFEESESTEVNGT